MPILALQKTPEEIHETPVSKNTDTRILKSSDQKAKDSANKEASFVSAEKENCGLQEISEREFDDPSNQSLNDESQQNIEGM